MKRLTLLRHAKSGWDDGVERDFDRPLNPKGRKAAQTIGREMKKLGLTFDAVLASPALRVKETIGEVEAGFGQPLDPDYEQRLYLASVDTLLDIVHQASDQVESLLLIGHNPGLETLTITLSTPNRLRGEAEIKYPTATLAELHFDAPSWKSIAGGQGSLARFVRPRDIDPTLGPDE